MFFIPLIFYIFAVETSQQKYMMTLAERLASLAQLGQFLQSEYGKGELEGIYRKAEFYNGWFSPEQSRYAITAMAKSFLDAQKLEAWVAQYPDLAAPHPPKTIGLVLAGNIPAVGFHDLLCCYVAGHKAQIKYSEKDKVLIPFFLGQLAIIAPKSAAYFEKVDKLKDFDAVIATGSDNASRYFEHYFGAYPNIIRKNRNSAAILDGQETEEELLALGEDIFRYFGLGCRSVSKLFVPQDFSFENFMRSMDHFGYMMQHHKYRNNYDYNRSIYLLNNQKHWTNNVLTLVEHPSPLSRISTVHYEFYEDLADLKSKLEASLDQLQLILGKTPLEGITLLPFGSSQQPQLDDYADQVDTLRFLIQCRD